MSLSSLRRRLTPGTVIYLRECLTGWVEPSQSWREVIQCTANAAQFKRQKEGGEFGKSYLYWPSAANVRETPDGFAVYETAPHMPDEPSRRVMTARYTWTAPAADEKRTARPGFWYTVPGTDTAPVAAAARPFSVKVPDGIERNHAEALLGEVHGWTIDAATVPGIVAMLESFTGAL